MFPSVTSEPLPVYAGDTTEFSFRVRTPSGTPYDLSNWDDWTCMWRGSDNSEVYLDVSVAHSPESVITVHMTAEMTRAMTGSGTFDVQAKQGPTVRTFVRSKTKRTLDVTP